ncbi:phosphate acetyltransferase [Nigerium massiliense]|uniref:phosphate acetyltransferase n=1 Tax=Nigerium massiliense TaxID=1522317 RepID=UPI00059088B2|nr:phosphate acetyltransferase [Nigerium massiliense]
MTRSIYVAAPEAQTGESIVALGIIDSLTREVSSIGVFRPLIRSGRERDSLIETLINQPGVNQRYHQTFGVTYEQYRANPDEAMTTIVDRYGAIKNAFDAIIIIGSDFPDATRATELAVNGQIAANLNAPVALTVSARGGRSAQEVRTMAENAMAELNRHHAKTVAVIATRVEQPDLQAVRDELEAGFPDTVTAAIAADPILPAPSLGAQFESAEAQLLSGRPEQLLRESQGVLVAGMTLPNVLDRLFEEATVILAADRAEMIPGILLAHSSGAFPALAGLILVGGYEIPRSVQQLMNTVHHELPIAVTNLGTYTTASRLFHLEGTKVSSPRKIEVARRVFSEGVDTEKLLATLALPPADVRTPVMFEYQLNEMARRNQRTIVLPESSDDRILEAASVVLRRGTAGIMLLGDATTIKNRAVQLGLTLNGAEIFSTDDPELLDRFSAEYARLRAKKGVTIEQAREKMADPSYFGTMMVHMGMAHGMVSGAANTTANTIRPSLEFIKMKPGVEVVSSSFLMCMADRVHVYGDCAVNPDPNAQQLADIAIGCADTAAAFDIEPRVAMLSYSTGESGSGADVDKVREATKLVRERRPDLKVEGPIQFDAAVDPAVGSKKMPGSEVAGQASVFIFPDLNTGNNTYKAVQRSAGAVAIGPVLQGLNKPVNDLSRGALVEDIVNTIAITAIQAQQS